MASLVIAVVLGVGAVWVTGGFGTGTGAFLGPQIRPHETVETRFWDIAVHAAEVSEVDGAIRVETTIMNKQERTAAYLSEGVLVVRLPGGIPMFYSTCVVDRVQAFAPFIPAEAVCEFSYLSNDTTQEAIPGPGEFAVEVVVRDQEMSDDLLTMPEPQAGEPAGWLPLTVSTAVEDEQ